MMGEDQQLLPPGPIAKEVALEEVTLHHQAPLSYQGVNRRPHQPPGHYMRIASKVDLELYHETDNE